jgi:hypothetical protein
MFFVSFCLVILMSGVRLLCIRIFSNWVCWVRGNFSGGPGHVYIPCLYLFAVKLAGRYNLFGHSGGVDGGTVQIFFLLWLYSGGYCTGEMVRGG